MLGKGRTGPATGLKPQMTLVAPREPWAELSPLPVDAELRLSPSSRVAHSQFTCPGDGADLFRRDAQDLLWEAWTSRGTLSELRPRPFLQPVQAWLRKHTDAATFSIVRHAISCGQTTQSVLHEWDPSREATCRSCGLAEGTPAHR